MTAAGLDVDALAVEISAQGFGEFVDFYIANRAVRRPGPPTES
ncbi:hypothetical protein [Aeromicrobium sp.]|nr:hypothetical protein [Aeromicrobium sp.]